MPKINRIRIVNFSYNDNNRHIIDEMFDFYGGESTLLSLANGGGKSVLVQAMFQPILPRITMLGRKFTDFFQGRANEPTYIVIEWKLDDNAGYLLTGIAISKRSSYTANEEDLAVDIRYYTFTKFYDEGNEYDIKNIPVTENKSNKIRIADYNEFNKLLKKVSEKRNSNLSIFSSQRDEQREYEKILSSYNISKDEWKELMVKINDNEYGVAEVFSECKTSKAVMEKWIIRYIEKVLNKSQEGDHKKLENMMFQVAQSLVSNESHIRDYNIISEFLKDIEELDAKTKEILAKIEIEEKNRDLLIDGYRSLLFEKDRLEQLNIACDVRIQGLRNELRLIDLEEISQEIYIIESEIKDIEDVIKSLEVDRAGIIAKKERAIFTKNVQIAAEKYEQLKEKKIKKAQLEESYANASKNEEKLLKDMNRVKYSLKLMYKEGLDRILKNIDSLNIDSTHLKDNLKEAKEISSNLDKEIFQLGAELGGVNKEIENFEKGEEIILNKLNITLYRSLLKELDSVEVDKIRKSITQNIEKSKQAILENENNLIAIDKDLDKLGKDLDKVRNTRQANSLELFSLKRDIENFQNEKDKIVKILDIYRLKEDDIYNKEYVLKLINEKRDNWISKEFIMKNKVIDIEKIIAGILEGVSYLPESLVSILKEKNISIFTGESYLRELDDKKKLKLLEDNPLLPYSILVSNKEYLEILDALNELEITSIVPIIKQNEREDKFNNINSVSFLTNPKSMYVGKADIDNYKFELSKQLQELRQEIEEAQKAINECNIEYQTIIKFEYTRNEVEELLGKRTRLLGELKSLETKENEIINSEKWLKAQQDNINKYILQLNREVENEENRLQVFVEYLEKDKEYIENLRKYSMLSNTLHLKESKKKSLENEINDIWQKIRDLEDNLRNERALEKDLTKKYNKVKDVVVVDLIEGTLEELEGKLISYESKRGQDLANISLEIQDVAKDMDIIIKDINELGLNKEDYINTIFSIENKENSIREILYLEKEEKRLDRVSREKIRYMDRLSGKKEALIERLKDEEIIPIEKIRGDFEERIKKAKEEINSNEESIKEYSSIINKIVTIIANIQSKVPSVTNVLKGEGAYRENILKTIDSYLKEYEISRDNSELEIKRFKIIVDKFKLKNNNIEQIIVKKAFDSIIVQINTLDKSYGKYYYLYERLQANIKSLNDYKVVMDEKMKLIEHSRKDLAEHAFMEAERIYQEIPNVSENSTVEIDGIRRKILDIRYEEMTENSKEQMKNYINECLDSLIVSIKNEAEEGKIRREIEKIISTKELLNVISNLDKCVIRSFKVDINERNRKMRTWEEVIVKNSGAEKFMAYFSLLVALISYSRRRMRGTDIFGKKEDSKVLIMDNPFGAITSGHLLKPLFDIANKYNTQLICLSDIKQGSVLNSFNLVYMIKIRQNMMKEDFIELESILKMELEKDEKLEKAYLYTTVEQMNLF